MFQSKSDPPCNFRFGATQVLSWLWLAGEEDVDEPLQEVDIWIDFRDENPWNRKIVPPPNVTVLRFPFADGDSVKAEEILPLTKKIIDFFWMQEKKILISCHAGVSRSAVLALWLLADVKGFDKAWCELKMKRPHVEPHENFYNLIHRIQEEAK